MALRPPLERPAHAVSWQGSSCPALTQTPPEFVSGIIVAVITVVLIKYSSDDLLVRHVVDRKCVFSAFPITLSVSCLVCLGRPGDNSVLTERESGRVSLEAGEGLVLVPGRDPGGLLRNSPAPLPSNTLSPQPSGLMPGSCRGARPIMSGSCSLERVLENLESMWN